MYKIDVCHSQKLTWKESVVLFRPERRKMIARKNVSPTRSTTESCREITGQVVAVFASGCAVVESFNPRFGRKLLFRIYTHGPVHTLTETHDSTTQPHIATIRAPSISSLWARGGEGSLAELPRAKGSRPNPGDVSYTKTNIPKHNKNEKIINLENRRVEF